MLLISHKLNCKNVSMTSTIGKFFTNGVKLRNRERRIEEKGAEKDKLCELFFFAHYVAVIIEP